LRLLTAPAIDLMEAQAMSLIWVMLLVLAASYGLCGALVLFSEWVIRPRGTEIAVLIPSSHAPLPQSADRGRTPAAE